MATDYTPTNVTTGFGSEAQINQNFTEIQTALNAVLARVNSTSNAMTIDLDMGGNDILNLPTPVNPNDPLRLQDVNSLAISDVVQTITFAPAMSVDIATMTIGKITLTANSSITFTGTPSDGQPILFFLRQDVIGNRTITWDVVRARFGADVPNPVLSTGANKLDYVMFRYNADDDKFDLMAVNRGF